MKKLLLVLLAVALGLSAVGCGSNTGGAASPAQSPLSSADSGQDTGLYDPAAWTADTKLVMDTSGYEEVGEGEYLKDGLLYVKLGVYPASFAGPYDENIVFQRICSLVGDDIVSVTVGHAEEDGARLKYSVWTVQYDVGQNEDTVRCRDLYFYSKTSNYWAHTQAPVDSFLDYFDEIVRVLGTVEVVEAG